LERNRSDQDRAPRARPESAEGTDAGGFAKSRKTMRQRKRADTHDVRVMKFRCKFDGSLCDGMKLPEALFRAAKGMNDAWSDIARELETAYAAWKPT